MSCGFWGIRVGRSARVLDHWTLLFLALIHGIFKGCTGRLTVQLAIAFIAKVVDMDCSLPLLGSFFPLGFLCLTIFIHLSVWILSWDEQIESKGRNLIPLLCLSKTFPGFHQQSCEHHCSALRKCDLEKHFSEIMLQSCIPAFGIHIYTTNVT